MENTEVEVVEQENNTTQDIDYKSLYEEKEAKVNELESLIQKHKKAPKEKIQSNNVDVDSLLEKKLAERDFYASNPDFTEHKEKIDEFTSKGLNYEQAKKLVIDSDPTIQNRAIAQQTNFTAGEPSYQNASYTKEELGNMKQADYNRVMDLVEKGKVSITQ